MNQRPVVASLTRHASLRIKSRGIEERFIKALMDSKGFIVPGLNQESYHLIRTSGNEFIVGIEKDRELITIFKISNERLGNYLAKRTNNKAAAKVAPNIRVLNDKLSRLACNAPYTKRVFVQAT